MTFNKWPFALMVITTLAIGFFGIPAVIVLADLIGKPTALATGLFYVGAWGALIMAPTPAPARD